jgi:hypothetical protein
MDAAALVPHPTGPDDVAVGVFDLDIQGFSDDPPKTDVVAYNGEMNRVTITWSVIPRLLFVDLMRKVLRPLIRVLPRDQVNLLHLKTLCLMFGTRCIPSKSQHLIPETVADCLAVIVSPVGFVVCIALLT